MTNLTYILQYPKSMLELWCMNNFLPQLNIAGISLLKVDIFGIRMSLWCDVISI